MTTTITRASYSILAKNTYKNSPVYQGILELLARFSYASIEEIRYGFELELMPAVHRLYYLETHGELIRRFPSDAFPRDFYCLTASGRQVVQDFRLSDEIQTFVPSDYTCTTQKHHRSIIQVYLALRKILCDAFLGWTSERQLKSTEEWRQQQETASPKRILDGELLIQIKKNRYEEDNTRQLLPVGDPVLEPWRCGIEIELSAKSAPRYAKQFKELSRLVYDSWGKIQHYPMMLFLCGSAVIAEKIMGHLKSGEHNFGACLFYVAQIDEFLKRQGEATLVKIIREQTIPIRASEMAQVKFMVQKS